MHHFRKNQADAVLAIEKVRENALSDTEWDASLSVSLQPPHVTQHFATMPASNSEVDVAHLIKH